ncbi:hypothetical protein [Streptomyces erythrochromogenes]|uniref:hypothetical protein n=1 Tax=Streptomyces erythrochromogenes TaxID=285574 RepID=UPI00367F8828
MTDPTTAVACDMRRLTFLDPAGLQLLLDLADRLEGHGIAFFAYNWQRQPPAAPGPHRPPHPHPVPRERPLDADRPTAPHAAGSPVHLIPPGLARTPTACPLLQAPLSVVSARMFHDRSVQEGSGPPLGMECWPYGEELHPGRPVCPSRVCAVHAPRLRGR